MCINHGASEMLPGGFERIPAFNKQEQTETFFLKISLLCLLFLVSLFLCVPFPLSAFRLHLSSLCWNIFDVLLAMHACCAS